MVYLALDYGERYVGVAISDPEGRLALRYGVIDQQRDDVFDWLLKTIATERVTKIVVGVPVSLEGKETAQTRVTNEFMRCLQEAVDVVEVVGADETLTSVEAEERIKLEGLAKNEAHAEAARLILESYLRQ